jgi:hypothetical protein
MLSHYQPLARLAFICVLLGNATSCQKGPTHPDVDVASITAAEAWKLLFETNRAWLDPRPHHLTYTVTFAFFAPNADPPFPEAVNRVWLSNDCARWEMNIRKPENDDKPQSYVLVKNGNKEAYLDAPHREMIGKSRPASDHSALAQGITWASSLQALAKHGLPQGSSIVERHDIRGGHVLVLETDLGKTRRNFGLGFFHFYAGHFEAPIGRVRIHIKTPEFIPIREEFLEDKSRIEYDPDFIVIGHQVAPKTIRYVRELPSSDAEWILESHFRTVDGNWLLQKAYNIREGKVIVEMKVSKVSTRDIDPILFELTKR